MGQPPDKPDPLLGESLDEFEILGLIGRGGMGRVYKARQPSLERLVALKVLNEDLSRDAHFVERFVREARAAAAVVHPNIVQVHAVGQDRGRYYIAMELVEGESLGDLLWREGRLPPDRALDAMRQAAAALAEAHACGIVHRDIKPSNILLTRRGQVKVADFGLAKREGVDVTVTEAGHALGTPLYMPPEAARGRKLDARSDLYSLGATFYQMLAGRPPFEGKTVGELVAQHLEAQPQPLAEAAPGTPPALCAIIGRLLLKDPDARFQSAEDVLAALEAVPAPDVAGTELMSGTTRTSGRMGRRWSRRRVAAAAIVGGVVSILISTIPGPRARQPAAPPGAKAPEPAPKTTPLEAPDWREAWWEADARAKALVGDQRFGEAIAVYEAVARRLDEPTLRGLAGQATSEVYKQAEAAVRDALARARELLRAGQFDEARSALRPVRERFGSPGRTQEVDALLGEIDAAESPWREK